MAIGYVTALRTTRLEDLVTLIDANGTAGKVKLYTTPRPATGAAITSQTLLGTLTWPGTCKATNTGGVLTFNALDADASADASGDVVWARITDAADNFVADMSVTATGGGGDITMNTITVVAGGTISGTATRTITEGNP